MFQAILEGQTGDCDPLVNAAQRLMAEQASPPPRVSSSATLSESLIFSEAGGERDAARRLSRKVSVGRRTGSGAGVRSGAGAWRRDGLYTRQQCVRPLLCQARDWFAIHLVCHSRHPASWHQRTLSVL
jgi:hypothetical protein